MEIPTNLIFDDSKIEICFEENSPVNRTADAIIIEGTRHGFLSLSNCLIFLANALMDTVDLSQLQITFGDFLSSVRTVCLHLFIL